MTGETASATGKDERRLGYYVAHKDGKYEFKVAAKAVDKEVLTELNAVIEVVFFLQPILIALETLLRNRLELFQFVEQHREELTGAGKPHLIEAVTALEAMVEASRRATNVLSSATAFLSLTEATLTRVHGKESSQLREWNRVRREMHGASFAYRLLYELRNFTQHRGLPISNFNIQGERRLGDGPMTFETKLSLHRDKLLISGFDWAKLRVELEDGPDEFDLLPLVDEYAAIIEALALEVFMMEGPRLATCVKYMETIERLLQMPDGAVPVFFVGESNLPHAPPNSIEIIPAEQLGWLMQHWDALLNRVHPTAPTI